MQPEELASLIASRRSNIFIDATSHVSDSQINALITAAQFAPNHKRTWPLRVCVVRGESREQLGHTIADSVETRGDDPAKVAKTRTKYTRAPLVLVVAYAQGNSDSETIENSYAVAAGIQNLLLQAESFGFAALWSTPAKGANEAITGFCDFAPTDTVAGIVYVGSPARPAPEVERPHPTVTYRN
jgi:nitroreductase